MLLAGTHKKVLTSLVFVVLFFAFGLSAQAQPGDIGPSAEEQKEINQRAFDAIAVGRTDVNPDKFVSLSKALPGILEFEDGRRPSLPALLSEIFFVLIAIGAVLAILRIAMGGIKYMVSESFSTKESAKKDLSNSVLGLVVMLAAVMVLQYINPALVNVNIFEDLQVTPDTEQQTADAGAGADHLSALQERNRCQCEERGVAARGADGTLECRERLRLGPNEEELEPRKIRDCSSDAEEFSTDGNTDEEEDVADGGATETNPDQNSEQIPNQNSEQIGNPNNTDGGGGDGGNT